MNLILNTLLTLLRAEALNTSWLKGSGTDRSFPDV